MPFISSKINSAMTKEQEEVIKSELGKAIELIPGKTEHWLMIDFEQECSLYFKGLNEEKIAFIEVKIFGSGSRNAFSALTSKICKIYNEILDIPPANIYIKYEEVPNWGWNGGNF